MLVRPDPGKLSMGRGMEVQWDQGDLGTHLVVVVVDKGMSRALQIAYLACEGGCGLHELREGRCCNEVFVVCRCIKGIRILTVRQRPSPILFRLPVR